MLQHKEDIGKLDKRVTFQQKTIGVNVSNEDEETGWQDVATTWASKEDRNGVEKYAADRLTGFQGAEFVIRWRNDVNIKMRLVCEGLAYNIISFSEIGRKRFMTVLTESGYDYVNGS